MEKISLRLIGVLGITLFLPLFIFTFADPQLIEKSAKSFIEWKLQSETDKKIDSINLPEPTKLEIILGDKAKELRTDTELKLEEVKQQLKADTPAILAAQIAKLRNLDCECRQEWEQRLTLSLMNQLASLEQAKAKLIDFSHAKYMEIVTNLTFDIRIFLGANSLAFIMLLALSFLKPVAVKHMFLPGVLLLVSTLICSYFYLFEQNWFYTIIYNDYTGYGYIGYLGFVFAILADIALNRAIATTAIINTILQAIGLAAASLASC